MQQPSDDISFTPSTAMTEPRISVQRARRRLRRALTIRNTPSQVMVGLCAVILGFGLVASTSSGDDRGLLTNARTDELIRILDDLSQRQERLDAEQRELLLTRQRLEAGNPQEALEAARDRANALAVLAGTVAVDGRGITMRITDPIGIVDASMILNAVQELRDAGAQAISVGPERVVAATWFADSASGILVSGTVVRFPVTILAIGDPATLAPAMNIPGGVADSIRAVGARITIAQSEAMSIEAIVRNPVTPPLPSPTPS